MARPPHRPGFGHLHLPSLPTFSVQNPVSAFSSPCHSRLCTAHSLILSYSQDSPSQALPSGQLTSRAVSQFSSLPSQCTALVQVPSILSQCPQPLLCCPPNSSNPRLPSLYTAKEPSPGTCSQLLLRLLLQTFPWPFLLAVPPVRTLHRLPREPGQSHTLRLPSSLSAHSAPPLEDQASLKLFPKGQVHTHGLCMLKARRFIFQYLHLIDLKAS